MNRGLNIKDDREDSRFRDSLHVIPTNVWIGDDDGCGLHLAQNCLGLEKVFLAAYGILGDFPLVPATLNSRSQYRGLQLAQKMSASPATLKSRGIGQTLVKRFVALRCNCIATRQNRGTVHI